MKRGKNWGHQDYRKRERDRLFRSWNERNPESQLIVTTVVDDGIRSHTCRDVSPDLRAQINAFKAKQEGEAA